MRFDAIIEVVFADGTEITVKVSELLKMAYNDRSSWVAVPWRAYVSKRLVAESKSWHAEPDPDDLEELPPEPATLPEPSAPRIVSKDTEKPI